MPRNSKPLILLRPFFVMACFLSFGAPQMAHATPATSTYQIGTGNTAISSYTSPFATLTLTQQSAQQVKFEFVGLSATTSGINYTYLFGGSGAVDLNLNSDDFAVSNITETSLSSGYKLSNTKTNYPKIGSGNISGFGLFNLTLTNFDGYQYSNNIISFVVTNNSSTTSWSGLGDVLSANSLGNYAAIHTFICATTCSVSSGAVATGYAAQNGGTYVPTPAPLETPLTLLGLLVIGGLYLRLRGASPLD